MNAIYVWGVTRALGGTVLLRIEDHDRVRSRPEFEAALLEDLDWLGFVPDSGRTPIVRQSDTPDVYEHALAQLARQARVYACTCSRRDIRGERYSGRCRERALPESATAARRARIERGVERFDDLLLGELALEPAAEFGDVLVRDRDGHWTYQFAVTVDDAGGGVTLVIRGADLVSSTGRQMALARMLGRHTPPVFLHHPLLVGAGGQKLSKSARDTGVRDLRREGLTAPAVIGRAAAAVGLIERERDVPADEVAALFCLR